MFANSRQISSSQIDVHPRLDEVVQRHLATPYLRAPSAMGVDAFGGLVDRLAHAAFVLDAGCGTGQSTLALAREFPHRLVIGVDKSAARLAIGERLLAQQPMLKNVLLLHCELVDFWQLAARANLQCAAQYLLYPNPWPKPEHLKRRWHGHAVFPSILALGGAIELRSNWRIYADEFVQALRLVGLEVRLDALQVTHALTPFERKYAASAHPLWRCRTELTRLALASLSGQPDAVTQSIAQSSGR